MHCRLEAKSFTSLYNASAALTTYQLITVEAYSSLWQCAVCRIKLIKFHLRNKPQYLQQSLASVACALCTIEPAKHNRSRKCIYMALRRVPLMFVYL